MLSGGEVMTRETVQSMRRSRAAVVRRESDLEIVLRRAQDAFLPFLIVALAWVLATSASTVR